MNFPGLLLIRLLVLPEQEKTTRINNFRTSPAMAKIGHGRKMEVSRQFGE
jgi:hypothetical protein